MSDTPPTIRARLADFLPAAVEDFARDYLDQGWINIWGHNDRGDRWAFALSCESRFEAPGFKWDSTDETSSIEVAQLLVGSRLLAIDVDEDLVNPVLHFAGDQRLSVIADTHDDPWLFLLPELTIVGVHQDSPLA